MTDSPAHTFAREHHDRFYDQFLDLIRIRSISTMSQHAADVRAAAEWVAADMRKIGMTSVEIITVPGGRHPLVLGRWDGAGADAPTVLIYNHYDVQPAEMRDGWTSDPFEPVERDGKLFARGATDSKINGITQLKAVESLLATDSLPVNVILLYEGEEESGSESITRYIAENAESLKADVVVISDGGMIAADQPSITLGTRGIISMDLVVQGPHRDLHSGHYGGNVLNPVQALAEIIAGLHHPDGSVNVPGFYDNVREYDKEERAALAGIDPYIEEDWASTANPPASWGEPAFSTHERAGIRPTLEINGIAGGYAAEGFKTVLPAQANAKISCRLVADQDPARIFDLVQKRIAKLTPESVTATFTKYDEGSRAVIMERDSSAVQTAAAAYAQHWGKPVVYEMAGGSVPIAHAMRALAPQMVYMGYAYKGGGAHGPDENIVIANFDTGIATAISFLQTFK